LTVLSWNQANEFILPTEITVARQMRLSRNECCLSGDESSAVYAGRCNPATAAAQPTRLSQNELSFVLTRTFDHQSSALLSNDTDIQPAEPDESLEPDAARCYYYLGTKGRAGPHLHEPPES
jgi:hypothetical protein